MMKLPTIKFVFNRRKNATKKHPASVELRIGQGLKCKYLATGIRLLPKEWGHDRVTNRPDSMELNSTLDKFRDDVLKVINEMYDEGIVNIDEIPTRLERLHRNGKSFIDFMEERAEVRKYGRATGSKNRYDRFIRFFKEWGKIKFFGDITDKNILAFDKMLKGKGLKDSTKWNDYHRFLNSFILDGVEAGLVKRNPYKWLNIPKGKEDRGIHKFLTLEEMKRFEATDMHTDCLNRVRDLFIFQTYTCMSYIDMAAFDWNKVKDAGKGNMVYSGKRTKTGREFTFLILKPAMDVLKKYDYKLPIISNEKYGQYLKLCAQMAGIDKPLSSHWARHTGATLLLNSGVDMEVVAKVLGHSSTNITRSTYAKLLDKTVVTELNKVNKKLSDNKENKSLK